MMLSIRGRRVAMIALLWAVAPDVDYAAVPTADPVDQESLRTAFLQAHCRECHFQAHDDIGGGVRLDTLADDISADVATADLWQKVLRAVTSGEMPPEDKPRPDARELEAFLESLSEGLVAARRKLADTGKGITMRRLNLREYAHTIRDLIGLEPDVSNLPVDVVSGGYDTAGASLTISSDQFEAYLATARHSLGEWAARRKSRSMNGDRKQLLRDLSSRDLVQALKAGELKHDRAITALGDAGTRDPKDYQFADKGWVWFTRYQYLHFLRNTVDGLRQPRADELAYLTFKTTRARETLRIPHDWPPGRYRVTLRCGALPDSPRSRRFLEIGTPTNEFTILGCHEVLGTVDVLQDIVQEVTVTPTSNRDFIVRERRPNASTHESAHYNRFLGSTGKGVPFAIGIDQIQVEGPLSDVTLGDATLESLFPADGSSVDERVAREQLGAFAQRAFRGRTPPMGFVDALISLRREQLDRGANSVDAMIEPLAVILASPAFLYLIEPGAQDGARRQLSDHELATRLAYFLTAAPADAELLAAAAAGTLATPGALDQQADRLINSDRCRDFVEGFVYQWLSLERLEFFQFDPVLYWEFDDSTRKAARQEVYEFFTHVLRENMSTKEFLDSRWTVANGLLGSYYGLDGVHGPEWRIVRLPSDSCRGGLMGMAAVLAMGSNGIRTSPVERGAWVLRKLVDQPPPPAPANVPQLSRLEEALVTARQRIQMHQESPQCAHCHKKIDPIGFGMDNFDAAGRWRDMDAQLVRGKVVKLWPIDASGTFVDGRPFNGFTELKALVASRHDAFARSLTRNLLEYALGRPLGFADDPLVDAIHTATQPGGHRLRDIIHAIVRSEAFRTK